MWPILTDRVEWSVGLSVCHSREPCKNDRTDRDADWVVGLRELKELCIRWGPDPPMARDNFWREKGRPIAKYRDTLRWSVQKRLNRSRCRLGCTVVGSDGPKESCIRWGPHVPQEEAILMAEEWPVVGLKVYGRSAVSCAKMAEQIEMPWSRMGPRKHVLHVVTPLRIRLNRPYTAAMYILVHGQVTIIFVYSVCLFVCLFVQSFSQPSLIRSISIKLGHMLYLWV